MIITKQKSIDNILQLLNKDPVFIIGCSECATICQTGGEPQITEMKQLLEQHKIVVTGWKILEPACNKQNSKRLLKNQQDALNKTNKILVLACGNGAQTLSSLYPHLDIIPGTDTLFLGEITRLTQYEKRCSQCGECLLNIYGGICPITQCPKSMLNGPCGGVQNGKCEIDKNLDCIWFQTYDLLKRKNKLIQLKPIQPPKDWSKAGETKRCI